MANYQLPNNVVRTFAAALGSVDAAGDIVANPGATYSVTGVHPAGVAVVVGGAAGTDVTVNAIAQNTVGMVVTYHESGGVAEADFTWTLDTVSNVTPTSASFNSAATVTDVAQAVPDQTVVPAA